jgi:secreted trypsin-like serine protease
MITVMSFPRALLVAVRKGEYPFFVRVHHNWYPTCGGSLVTPDVILTAGHCFPPKENTHLGVLISGYHDGPFEKEGQYYRDVVETVRHRSGLQTDRMGLF